jgi:hypothetical protein
VSPTKKTEPKWSFIKSIPAAAVRPGLPLLRDDRDVALVDVGLVRRSAPDLQPGDNSPPEVAVQLVHFAVGREDGEDDDTLQKKHVFFA